MKTSQHHHHHHQNQPPKQLKPPNRSTSLFSCAFFRHCTDSPLSPTLPSTSPPLPRTPPPRQGVGSPPRLPPSVPPLHHPTKPSDSESSSSSTSQSFTQWRFPPTFPLPDLSPAACPLPPPPLPLPPTTTAATVENRSLLPSNLRELFHVAELHFTVGSNSDRLSALHMIERSLVPNPPSDDASGGGTGSRAMVVVPAVVMSGVIGYMKEKSAAKSATKILLALCLTEGNRRVAVECGAAARIIDALPDLEGSAAERALAALDLMCTLPEGAAEVRAHALAVPMLVAVMGQMEGRGREYAMSVLAAVYSGGDDQLWAVAPPEEVARAVMLAMQGDCSARGKRKGALLIKVLQENERLDLTQDT